MHQQIQNQILLGTLGFLITFGAFSAFALSIEPTTGAHEINPKVQDIHVGGTGVNDGGDLYIRNNGQVEINSVQLGTDEAGYFLDSNQAGAKVTSSGVPVYGTVQLSGTEDQSGVTGRLNYTNSSGSKQSFHGNIGHIFNFSNANQAMGNLYAFFTTQPTFIGGDAYFQGTIDTPSENGFSLVGDLEVSESIQVDELTTPYITGDFMDTLVTTYAVTQRKNTNFTDAVASNIIYTTNTTCPTETILIGCSGYVTQSNTYANYRGSLPFNSSCVAHARLPAYGYSFELTAVAYCLNL